jgi:DNA-directed RNA polymerase specialized sigma24 family protein
VETRTGIDFGELAVRLASYGLRTFREFGLGGSSNTIPGVGLSVEDFVSKVLSEYAEGGLAYESDRGALFSLLARALRNDIIDALRKAAHVREEARSPIPRENKSDHEPPALDELASPETDISTVLAEAVYRRQLLAAFVEEPELAEVVRVVLDLDIAKPREIAAALGITVADLQNRKKRLRRRLIEYRAVEASQA